MSPRQLLEKLENLEIIDSKILAKLRKEIENPKKTVKSKAVLNYLVKKAQITPKQASRLLKSGTATEDEMKVVQPVEKSYDTDDLTGLNSEEPPAGVPVVPVVAAPEATMMDDGSLLEADDDEVVEIQPDTVVSQVYEPELIETVEAEPQYDAFDQGGFDTGSGGYAAQPQKTELKSFRGKKDKRDQWATKWLYIGFGILGTLLIGVAVAYFAVAGQKPADMFEAAMTSFNSGSYGDAQKKFADFLDAFPNDKNAPTARAKRIHSIIRGTYGTKNWSETITQSRTLLPELEEEGEKLESLREDLSVMLPRSLVEITNKAAKLTVLPEMRKQLVVINELKETVDKPQYVTSSARKVPSVAENFAKIDNNIKTVVGQIDKEERYLADLNTIRELGEQDKTAAAFAVYQKLLRNYGDLAARAPLRDQMLLISGKESALVTAAEFQSAPVATERDSLIQKSVVLAARTGKTVEAYKDEITAFLADGAVYGIDTGTGTIVWRRHVGFVTNVQPQTIADEFLLISDQQNHDLVLVRKNSGDLVWRLDIGEKFNAPAAGDKSIVVTTLSGKIIQLNAANGLVEQTAQLPRQEERLAGSDIVANTSAMIATRDPFVYQTGYSDNLYVISTQDFTCKEVFYLGHSSGSISVPPLAWQGYILVCVNGGDHCNLLVLKSEKGQKLKVIQTRRISEGPITTPIQRFGRWMLVNSDNGQLKILELSPNSEKNPVSEFGAGLKVEANQPTYVVGKSSNMWVADSAIALCKVQRNNNGNIDRSKILEPNDTFISPIKKFDDYIFHVRRRNQSGMISASLVDSMTLKAVWRTDIGGELASPPMAYGNRLVTVSNQGDLFAIDPETIEAGYSDQAVKASEVIENLKFQNTLKIDEDTFVSLGPAGRKEILFAKGTTGQSKLSSLAAPADDPSCKPIVMGKNLIVPSGTGFIARMNPANGQRVGEPFQPEVKPGTRIPWFEPTKLSETEFAVAAGAIEDGSSSAIYILSVANPGLVTEVAKLVSDAPFRSRLVNNGKNIFTVIAKDGGDNLAALSASAPIAIQQTAELDGELVAGPWLTDAGILVQLDNDKLYCFGADLAKKWSILMPNEKLACEPQDVNDQVMITLSSGAVVILNSQTGDLVSKFDLGQPIIHEPFRTGQQMYASGRDGTIHVIDLSKLSGGADANQ